MPYQKTPRQGLYHSQLVQMTLTSPVEMTVDTPVKQSNHPDRNPHGYLGVTIDDKAFWLNCETAMIAGQLATKEKQKLFVVAEGSREKAVLKIMGTEPSPRDAELPAMQQQAPSPVAIERVNGQTVGMAVKEAIQLVSKLHERDVAHYLNTSRWKEEVFETARNIIDVSQRLEAGERLPF